MTAPIDFASRFNTSADPAELFRLLMQTTGNGAAPAEDVGADAGDEPTPHESAPDDNAPGTARPNRNQAARPTASSPRATKAAPAIRTLARWRRCASNWSIP